jgi:branched-chain amino acid transport system substrate-binding protein
LVTPFLVKEDGMRSKILIGLALTGVLAVTAGCSSQSATTGSDESASPLRVGAILPFSGNFALEGEEVKRGYELALQDVGGVVAGRTVELVFGDGFAPEDVIAETDRLATRENVEMFIGTYASPASQAGSETAARYGLPWWETHATSNTLTDRGLDNYFRSTATAVDFGTASAKFIIEGIGPKIGGDGLTVFIEHEDGAYGTLVSEAQTRHLKTAGYNVVVGAHKAGATDVTDSILAAAAANPDIWMTTGYVADSALLLRTASALKFQPQAMMLTGAGDAQSVLEAVGIKDLEGVFVTSYTSQQISEEYAPGMASFLKKYEAAYGSVPSDSVAMVGYSGMTAALLTLEKANGSAKIADLQAAASSMDLPFGSLPIGWGLSFSREFQNESIRMTGVQWRANGTTPAVWPKEAALEGEVIVLSK